MRHLRVNGIDVVAERSTLREEVSALRCSAALIAQPHVVPVRVTGEDAYDVLDRAVAADLLVRDGRIKQTLLLDGDARPISDLYVCNDDGAFLLVSEGMDALSLLDHLRGHAPEGARVAFEDMSLSHTVLSIEGPFAWELLAAVEGSEIIGFPYLSFYHPTPDRTYLRTGKAGEFGYDLIVPRGLATATWEELEAAGRSLDVRPAGIEALWHGALENGSFNIHRAIPVGVTPIELQLQWRVSFKKEYTGSEALRARRADVRRRLTWMIAERDVEVGAVVTYDGNAVGEVFDAAHSATLDTPIAAALLDVDYAHSGIDGFDIAGARGRTVSAPFIDNLSLHVNPQRQSYATRAEIDYPGPARA